MLEPCYLAGFFDGEGSISPAHNNSGRSLRVCLHNNYKPILDEVNEQFPGTVHKQGTSNCWQWTAQSASSQHAFLTFVLPHLKLRLEEAKIALAIVSTITKGRTKLTDQEFLVRETLFELLAAAADRRKQPFNG